jgi:DNA-binding NarL/FixJ family response regulator
MSVIRIMIVENDPNLMQSVNSALSKEETIEIVSTVSSRESAIKQLSVTPDIMLLIRMF